MSREHAALFQTFADLDYHNLSAILDFANAYGLLGVPRQNQSLMVGKAPQQRHHHAFGESHLDWAREICLMREALELTRSKSPEEVAADQAAWRRVQLEPPHKQRIEKLTWLFDLHLQQVQGRMVFPESGPPQLSFAPLTLLSAMWLQLALSVVGGKEFRACKHCRRLFEISTEETGFRTHRTFCSASCKTLDYRKRKRTALALIEKGLSVGDVAAGINTPKATVRAWISARKRQKLEKN
ncbi:MAG TPA: hypothetical protein VNJ04_07880 [Gemmatimonadaceae bacterium]|nr:hypothetical protein [Gemmatimonadaceae bacterium]